MIKSCKHCNEEFDTNDPRKIKLEGLINECPDCLEEIGDNSPPKYLGVAAGNGKMTDLTLLAFKDDATRASYQKAWRNNSGQNKGKSCQLGAHLTSMSGMAFKVVAENRANDNHKGKG